MKDEAGVSPKNASITRKQNYKGFSPESVEGTSACWHFENMLLASFTRVNTFILSAWAGGIWCNSNRKQNALSKDLLSLTLPRLGNPVGLDMGNFWIFLERTHGIQSLAVRTLLLPVLSPLFSSLSPYSWVCASLLPRSLWIRAIWTSLLYPPPPQTVTSTWLLVLNGSNFKSLLHHLRNGVSTSSCVQREYKWCLTSKDSTYYFQF